MKRAQGIKKRWFEFKSTDTENSKTIGLEAFLKYQYERYITLCNRCNEKPIPFSKWLYQDIDPAS